MSLHTAEGWWTKVADSTREWLLAHPEEQLSPEVLQDITNAGGVSTGAYWTESQAGPDGYYLSHAEWEFIEAQREQ